MAAFSLCHKHAPSRAQGNQMPLGNSWALQTTPHSPVCKLPVKMQIKTPVHWFQLNSPAHWLPEIPHLYQVSFSDNSLVLTGFSLGQQALSLAFLSKQSAAGILPLWPSAPACPLPAQGPRLSISSQPHPLLVTCLPELPLVLSDPVSWLSFRVAHCCWAL